MDQIPNHVAIVPDGNRRWASGKKMKPWDGHEAGAKKTEELVKKGLELGIKHLTFWGSSEDNLKKRPFAEKRALLGIYERYFKKLISSQDVYENNAKIRIVGRWKQQFPKNLTKILTEGIERTKNHSRHFLTFLLAYNGDDDVLHAANRISAISAKNKGRLEITKDNFSKYLLTSQLPDVDLLVRTGVENDPHNSVGFLMWQTRNSQYYFSDRLFPDFGAPELEKAIKNFSQRARRLGA